ncbi:unnamed protein product, partial [Closterium sp. NIES-53]
YSPSGAATALAAAATAPAAAATAPAAAAPAPSTAATALLVQLQPLLLPLQPLLLPLQPLLLPVQPLLLQLQPCWCSYSPCCCCYSPCCCHHSPCCYHYSPCCCRYSPCCCRYSPCCCHHSSCCYHYSPCCCRYSPCCCLLLLHALLLLLRAAAAAAQRVAATAACAAAATTATCSTAAATAACSASPAKCCYLLQLLLLAATVAPCCCCSLLPLLLATAAAGGGAAGSAGSAASAGGAGGATGSAGGAAGAGGAGPTTDRHCHSGCLGPCPPSRARLHRRAFPASRGGSAPLAPHFSEFPPTTSPLQTLHMDVWGPAPVGGTDQERYFLLVVDNYTRYTTVFPLRRKFSSGLLAESYRDEGIVQSFTLPASPQKNGIVERRIGLIMEVARTSMVHAAAPHFLWPFAVRYAAHQLNLWPRVFEPETSPTLRWTGKVGDASVFRVWGALSLVRDAKANKLSSRTLHCVFLGFPTYAPPWQFYHPRSRRVFSPRRSPLTSLLLEAPPARVPPAEGVDLAADDTAATRRSPHLETPPSFPPRPSSPPPQPATVDSGAETAGAGSRGATTRGAGSWGAATGATAA